MGKTLLDMFKINKRGKELDLVEIAKTERKDYKNKLNEVYSGIQKDREDYEKLLKRYSDGDILNHEQKKYGFGKGIKRAVTTAVAIASLGLAGCQQAGVSPKEYYEPTAKIYISPTSGTAPLTSNLNLESKVEGGNINKSYIFADYDGDGSMDAGEELASSDSGSINGSYTFTKSGEFDVYGQSESDQGKSSRSEPTRMNIQSATPTEPVVPVEPVEPIPDTDYVDISGRLEDIKNHGVGRAGPVEFYEDRIQNADGSFTYSDLLGETNADSDGKFSITLEGKVVDSSDKIYLRARTGTSSNPTSYKVTIELPATDHNPITDPQGNPAVRCVPYNPNWTIQQINDFPEHAGRVNFWSTTERGAAGLNAFEGVNGNSSHGLKKWNLGEITDTDRHPVAQGIEVYSDDFTEVEYNAMKTSIRNSGHPRANTITIQRSKDNYDYHDSNIGQGKSGWIFIRDIEHSPNGGPGAELQDFGADGYLEKAIVYVNNRHYSTGVDLYPSLTEHEIVYHATSASVGHSNGENSMGEYIPELPNLPSIGKYSSDPIPYPTTSQEVDKVMYDIIDEPTYLGMEKLDDILGL
jgi:hypothetical protein